MLCPHCSASLKYRERSNQVCSSCYKAFAFEPKTHPLRINDNYFQTVVNKLSDNGKLYFTPQQLQYAVSRKAMKPFSWTTLLIVFAVISTIIGSIVLFNIVAQAFSNFPTELIFFVYLVVIASIILFWIVLIFSVKKFHKPTISIPQSHVEFENSVLGDWRRIYQKFPDKLVRNFTFQENFQNLRGILLCQTDDAAICLNANQVDKSLNLAIVYKPQKVNELLQKHGKLPVYVLHDASIEGVDFLERIKRQIGNQTPVFEIGLRPQNVMKWNVQKMCEKGSNANFLESLTAEERDWLNQGYNVPLYVLRPEKLIRFVRIHITKKDKKIEETADRRAKSVGFMTWVGQK